MMLTMDPPRHTALHQLVNKGFTPRQVAKLNEHIAHMARDVVDSVIEKGQCDFVNDVAGALPSYVIAELLGIPLEDGYRLYELTEIMNSGVAGDANPRATEAAIQMFAYAAELATRKRAQPGDNIATSLLQAEVDGQRLTDMEFNMFFVLLLIAGGDTTRNLVAGGMSLLIEHPKERAKLKGPVAAPDSHRGDAALRQPSQRVLSHGHEGHRTTRGARQKGWPGSDVLPIGQPRRDPIRRSRPLRRESHAELARGVRRRWNAFLPRREPGPSRGDRPHVRSAVADEESGAGGAGRAHAVDVDQRHSLHACPVHARSTRGCPVTTRTVRRNGKDAFVLEREVQTGR